MNNIQDFDARRYPMPEGEAIGGAILLTVLVKRIEGTVKAYAGIVPDTSRADPAYVAGCKWVHKNGNPLSYREAVKIWPGLEAREYAQ